MKLNQLTDFLIFLEREKMESTQVAFKKGFQRLREVLNSKE